MTESGSPAMLPLEESPWLGVYEHMASLVEAHEEVIDLGCGTGRFIELLRRGGNYAPITGVDWSQAALKEAERYCRTLPQEADFPRFQLADLDEWVPDPDRAGGAVFVCSEVLEHLPDDLGLVRRVPPGHRFIFTLPNYESESHLRHFTGLGAIFERYSGLVDFHSWRIVGFEPKAIHILESRRRINSW